VIEDSEHPSLEIVTVLGRIAVALESIAEHLDFISTYMPSNVTTIKKQ
jgi:hypothetical protein